MPEQHFRWESTFSQPVEDLFAWHERHGAFERLNPPWRPVTVKHTTGGISNGARVEIAIPFGPFSFQWLLEHRDYIRNVQFCDYQIRGPFRSWKHVHKFEMAGNSQSRLEDTISYELPRGLGVAHLLLDRDLNRLFRYRHSVLAADLQAHERYRNAPRQRVLISGTSGLVGSALAAYLSTAGHHVTRLVRRKAENSNEAEWNPERGIVPTEALSSVDAVIHLGGDNVAEGLWTESKKRRIFNSRVESTRLLAGALAALASPPRTFIVASAIGFYGYKRSGPADESTPSGDGFLAEVCRGWEDAASEARRAGIRTVHLRIGAVLNPRGGVLRKLLFPFQVGAGTVLGDGSQGFSWIALQDLLGIIEHALFSSGIEGPINCTAPNPSTNREFSRTLAHVLRRPLFLAAPRKVIETVGGEMAREVLLSGSQVLPSRLLESGFQFQLPQLEEAIRFECGLE